MRILSLFLVLVALSWNTSSAYVPSRIAYIKNCDSIFLSGTQDDLIMLLETLDNNDYNDDIEQLILAYEIFAAIGNYTPTFDLYRSLYQELMPIETSEAKLQKSMIILNMMRISRECEYISDIIDVKGVLDSYISELEKDSLVDKYLRYDYYAIFTRYKLYTDSMKECGVFIDEFENFINREFPDLSPQRSEFLSLKGQYQNRVGNYTEAYESFKLSVNPYLFDGYNPDKKYGLTLAASLCNVAAFLLEAGDPEQALNITARAFNIYTDRGRIHIADYKNVCTALATYKALKGDFDTAIKIINETLSNDEAIHKSTGLHYSLIASRSMFNFRANRINEALEDLPLALQAYHDNLWDNYLFIAHIQDIYPRFFLDSKKYEEAIPLVNEALEFVNMFPTLPKRSYYHNLCRAHQGLNDYHEASKWYNNVIEELKEEVKHHFICFAERQRENFWKHESSYLLPILAHAPEGTAGVAGSLFNSSMLVNGLLLRTNTSIASAIESMKDQQDKLKNDFAVLRDLKAKAQFNPGNRQLVASAQRAERDILERLGLNTNSMAFVDNTWQHIQNRLGNDEVAVAFVYAGEEWGAIDAEWNGWYAAEIITKKHPEPIHVPLFKNCDINGQLPDLWSRKLNKYIPKGSIVYFVPAGALHNEPLEHLPYTGDKLLSDVCTPVRLSSMHELLGRPDFNQPVSLSDGATMYGGLNYNLGVEDMELMALESSDRGSSSWGYLPGTLDEVNTISELMQGTYKAYTGDEGVEETFKALSGNAPHVIHIASHGYYLPGEAMENSSEKALSRCGLLFTGANNFWQRDNGKPEHIDDGLLTGLEISSLDLSGTELVAMSACQTGLGDVNAEGVFGLQRAFKLAGARTLLVSLRDVNDQATAMFMKEFYANLASGAGRRSALKAAQAKVRSSSFYVDGKKVSGTDSRFWANFVLID